MTRKQTFLERPKHPTSLREACELIDGLWALVQDLRAINEQLKVNSANSSTPPSQDRLSGTAEKERRSKPSDKQRGAQPGHVRNTRKVVPESELSQIERHFPDTRCPCGGEVVIDADPKDRHQIFDLPQITYTVTEHQRFGGTCPCCHRSTVAKLPKQIPSGQMGPGLIAWIALLGGHFRMSTRNIQTFLEMQWGLQFSTGAISESQEPVAQWLEPLYDHVGDTVRKAPVAHADETTHFRGKNRLWLWVLCTPQLAFYRVHASRGMKAAERLLGLFAGVLVSDRHGAYGTHPSDQRQLCWAHIIRNLERIAGYRGDAGDLGRWLVHFSRIIIQLEHRWRKSSYQSEHCRRRLLAARENLKASLQQGAARHDGQKTGRICKELLKVEPMLWRFMASPGLDLTNNTAERALRPYVIWRKTSFFSQSERGDLFRARVMTVAETCRRLDLCAYTLLREVCEQGIRGDAVTIRLPIDHLYSIPASHQIEKMAA
jgi:transposase